jgi:hypothetical protein
LDEGILLISVSDSSCDREIKLFHEIFDAALYLVVVDQVRSVTTLQLLQIYIVLILTFSIRLAWRGNKQARNIRNLSSSKSERLCAQYGIDKVLFFNGPIVVFRHLLEQLTLTIDILQVGGTSFLEKFS